MAICTFFGHRDCPDSIRLKLREVLVDLITQYNVDMFFVGNEGKFDSTAHSVLQNLKNEYPQINYAVVLAYMPSKQTKCDDTMLPEGIESIHPRYAISWRNNWMLQQSDYVVTYITHSWGGAAQYAKKAKKMNKHIIVLGRLESNNA